MDWTRIYRDCYIKAKKYPLDSSEGQRIWSVATKISNHVFLNSSDEIYKQFTNDFESCEDCLGTGYVDGMTIYDYEKYGKGKERKPCPNCIGTGDVFWYHRENKINNNN